MNKVILQGRIQRIYEGVNVTIVTLFVHGYGNNFPKVIFTGKSRDLFKKAGNGLKVGNFVEVEGTIKVRYKKSENGGWYFEQFIKGISIAPAKTLLQEKFGKTLGGRFAYKNEVLITGEVVLANTANGIANVLIAPDGDNFKVWMSSFDRNPEKFVADIKEGSRVCVNCEIQTVRKEKDGDVKFFENVIIREIAEV